MESFFSRYKNSLVLALVLLAQFVLLAIQVRPRLPGAAAADQAGVEVLRRGVTTVVAPPEKVLHQGGLGIRGIWSSYIDLLNVREQNEQLTQENQRLQLEQAALAEDARQGERLQELLAFKQHYIDQTVPAQVVGAGGSDHGRVLYIDKGADDGVAAEMPVITPDGIVGRIGDSVESHTSQVLLISDPTSAAGVLLEETRTRGVLRGNSVGQPEIVNLMPDDRIQPGQPVLTSGGDQIFPRGLPVGVVDKVVPDVENQPLVDVILKPAANLSRLEEVLVVTGVSSTASPKSRRDLARSEGTAATLKAAAAAKASTLAEAALEAQRASDILAQKLPSAKNVTDPDAPDAAPGSSPATAADADAAPLHPPSALHADHYTPGSIPAAQSLSPGARLAPYAQGTLATERKPKAATTEEGALIPGPSVSPAFRAAHDAAIAARPHPPAPPKPPVIADTTKATAVIPPSAVPDAEGFVMKPLIRRVPLLNPDGTPVLNADGTPSVKRIPVLNPDGTPVMHRVLATPPAGAVGAPAPSTGALAASRTAVPATAGAARSPAVARPATTTGATPGATPTTRSTTPTAARPAATPLSRPAATPGGNAAAAQPRVQPRTPTQSGAGVPTRIISDGPIPAARPKANSGAPAAPQRKRALVPDDGSRPPAQQAAPPAPPQERP